MLRALSISNSNKIATLTEEVHSSLDSSTIIILKKEKKIIDPTVQIKGSYSVYSMFPSDCRFERAELVFTSPP